MTEEQKLALRCACADLIGALQARNQLDMEAHDWKAHHETICELINAFEFLADFAEHPVE